MPGGGSVAGRRVVGASPRRPTAKLGVVAVAVCHRPRTRQIVGGPPDSLRCQHRVRGSIAHRRKRKIRQIPEDAVIGVCDRPQSGCPAAADIHHVVGWGPGCSVFLVGRGPAVGRAEKHLHHRGRGLRLHRIEGLRATCAQHQRLGKVDQRLQAGLLDERKDQRLHRKGPLARRLHPYWRQPLSAVLVVVHGQPELPEIVRTRDSPGGLTG